MKLKWNSINPLIIITYKSRDTPKKDRADTGQLLAFGFTSKPGILTDCSGSSIRMMMSQVLIASEILQQHKFTDKAHNITQTTTGQFHDWV